MSVDIDDLLDAIENSFFALPQIPGKVELHEVRLGGVEACSILSLQHKGLRRR